MSPSLQATTSARISHKHCSLTNAQMARYAVRLSRYVERNMAECLIYPSCGVNDLQRAFGPKLRVCCKQLSSNVRDLDVATTLKLSGTDKGNPRGCYRLNPVNNASLTGTEGISHRYRACSHHNDTLRLLTTPSLTDVTVLRFLCRRRC